MGEPCLNCGYELEGVPQSGGARTCPECGQVYETRAEDDWPGPRIAAALMLAPSWVVFLLGAAGWWLTDVRDPWLIGLSSPLFILAAIVPPLAVVQACRWPSAKRRRFLAMACGVNAAGLLLSCWPLSLKLCGLL